MRNWRIAAILLVTCSCGSSNQRTTQDAVTDASAYVPDGSNVDAPLPVCTIYGFGNLDVAFSDRATYVELADIDGDGKLDAVAIAGSSGSFLQFARGRGDGTFEEPITSGETGELFVVADVDLDNHLDVVATADGKVWLHRGQGNGRFDSLAQVATLSHSSPTNSVVVADFNTDGFPDIVFGGNEVGIAFGHGDGTFAPTTIVTAAVARTIAMGDFNSDGKLDIALATLGPNSLQLLWGNGLGSFTTGTSIAMADPPTAMAVADLDSDGHLDVAIGAGAGVDGGYIRILRGNGAGQFPNDLTDRRAGGPQTILMADLNGDNKPELLSAVRGVSAPMRIQYNLGNGGFGPIIEIPTSLAPFHIATGNLTPDGKPDILVSNADTRFASVLINKGDGSFPAFPRYPVSPQRNNNALYSADLNRDGVFDILTTNYEQHSISVLLGHADGTFAAHADYEVYTVVRNIAVVDLDDDGWPDLIAATNGDTATFHNRGDGTFEQVHYETDPAYPIRVAVGDLTGDGIADQIFGSSTGLSIRRGISGGAFAAREPLATPGCTVGAAALELGDMNGDGSLDIFAASSLASCALLNDGAGHLTSSETNTTYDISATRPLIDFNGDHKLDLVRVSVFGDLLFNLGNGDGTFSSAVAHPDFRRVYAFQVLDINGDGRVDIISATDNALMVATGRADGTFDQVVGIEVGDTSSQLAIFDANHDGRTDVVALGLNSIVVVLNRCLQ